MSFLKDYFNAQSWLALSQHFNQEEGQLAFAHTNALLRWSNQQQQPIFHFWTLDKTIILGMLDTKLPYFDKARQMLHQHGYATFVRNAGGLGVVADQQVLNVGLYLPNIANQLSVTNAYELTKQLIDISFATSIFPIENFEVTHSYCPGHYDLSIAGKKFAGLAQRRAGNGVAIMIYLSINGNQTTRGQLMRAFYTTGLQGTPNLWNFPEIQPDSMANLSELRQTELTITTVKARLLATLKQQLNVSELASFVPYLTTADYQSDLAVAEKNISRHNTI